MLMFDVRCGQVYSEAALCVDIDNKLLTPFSHGQFLAMYMDVLISFRSLSYH